MVRFLQFCKSISIKCIVDAIILFLFLSPAAGFSQSEDTTNIILISSIEVQIEATQALNDLYNFKFEKAEQQFRWLKQKYIWHPLPYFLLGLSEWWKIFPNMQDTSHDDRFLAYMDSAITRADHLYQKFPEYKVEAAFFLAASYGFKGRLYADEARKNWRKAAAEGKTALDYLEVCRGKTYLSPELVFGDALYNYFSVWVPENYPMLKPVLWFFPKGDKALGVQQLKEVSYNGFYTRTEAMVWLMRILNAYENDQVRAFQLAEYLYQTYPDNSYFHRYYARMLYSRGMLGELEGVCKEVIARIDRGQVGYEATSGRYAAFFLGQLNEGRRDLKEAKKYYLMTVKYAEEIDAIESGYYLFSLIALGEISQKEGDAETARKYFNEVKKKAGRKDEAYKDAKRRLKNLEKGD